MLVVAAAPISCTRAKADGAAQGIILLIPTSVDAQLVARLGCHPAVQRVEA